MKEKEFETKEIYLASEKEVETVSKRKKNEALQEESMQDDKKPMEIYEIPKKRESHKKVFQLNNGCEKAVFYSKAQHVYNEEIGSFNAVDACLVEEADGRHFKNDVNRFIARFSREENNDELFSMEQDEHKVTVFARKNKKQRNQGVIPKLCRKRFTDDPAEEKDILTFENAMNGSDLEYRVTGNGVKEDIIIKERTDVYQYPFLLKCENLTVTYDEAKKRVLFGDATSNETIFFIPAPFMMDANGEVSHEVFYEVQELTDGNIAFTVLPERDWLNAPERVFPVKVDPPIEMKTFPAMTTYIWDNGSMAEETESHLICTNSYLGDRCLYMALDLSLPRNAHIRKAELTFTQKSTCFDPDSPMLELYHVTDPLYEGSCTPKCDNHPIGCVKVLEQPETIDNDSDKVRYCFDITQIIMESNENDDVPANLMLKYLPSIPNQSDNSVELWGKYGQDAPIITVEYDVDYSVNTASRVQNHEISGFGQGGVDMVCGKLMLETEDFAWGGSRMPVTIRHLYTGALEGYAYTFNEDISLNVADFSAMKLGYGWKLNLMQSMRKVNKQYVYTMENGDQLLLNEMPYPGTNTVTGCGTKFQASDGSGMIYDTETRILTDGEEKRLFDASGRLIRVTDAYGNQQIMTYTASRLSSVRDGAGREFNLFYDNAGFLSTINAPDGTSISYTYENNRLRSIVYPNGRKAVITYVKDKLAFITIRNHCSECEVDVYAVGYNYSGERLTTVYEYGVDPVTGDMTNGTTTTYSYSAIAKRGVVTKTEALDAEAMDETTGAVQSVHKTVYLFDDSGNITQEYSYLESDGTIGVGAGGTITDSMNLLCGHTFDTLDDWVEESHNSADTEISPYYITNLAKYGQKVLSMRSTDENCVDNGVYQEVELPAGGAYTFSAYVRVSTGFTGCCEPGARLLVTDTRNHQISASESLSIYEAGSDYVRLSATFEALAGDTVRAHIVMNGAGGVFVCGPQLENKAYVSPYNYLENGGFESDKIFENTEENKAKPETHKKGWTIGNATYSSEMAFSGSRSLMLTGGYESGIGESVLQRVTVRNAPSTRETFILSGWAKGYAIPMHNNDSRNFALRAQIFYENSKAADEKSYDSFIASFAPGVEEWQYASVEFSKSRRERVSHIRVWCEYFGQPDAAYFDNIQLVCVGCESDLSNGDFSGASGSDYVAASNSNEDSSLEEESADITVDASNDFPVFEEVRDAFGNMLTETTYQDTEFGTMYRAFGYDADGNDLTRETDTRGNETTYVVDEDTSRKEEVTDREGNKTRYEYDHEGRTTRVASCNPDGTEIGYTAYEYDALGNMTQILRGDGQQYYMIYNHYHRLESIGIGGKGALVTNRYKEGTDKLKSVTYANGHVMKVKYNAAGQIVSEKWYADNSTETPMAHYQYAYDGEGNVIRSLDILGEKLYTYKYEGKQLVESDDWDVTIVNAQAAHKTAICKARYRYDDKGFLVKKIITPKDGDEIVYHYKNVGSEDSESAQMKITLGGRTITSRSKADGFGRKTFDELELGVGHLYRHFTYHDGEIPTEHTTNEKCRSMPTTQLVKKIVLSDGRILEYEYDREERITMVVDSMAGVTQYTYDAQGQLLTETLNGETVNEMTYDAYGNIQSKNGVVYTYATDSAWKDQLISVDGTPITYDAQGNPTTYLNHTLTWEKGRQLKSYDNHTYTYNANGIRTSKTLNGVKHDYVLDGTKIIRETWGNHELIPVYDNEDSVCGIVYNGTPYYFVKNLQGDVIAIADKDAQTVARYSYDAWGVPTIVQDTTACNIATINPFRYRGYYYDEEIELYYLQSRYYDAKLGRFVNVDTLSMITVQDDALINNLFTYCNNDPANNTDNNGKVAIFVTMAIGALFGLAIQWVIDMITNLIKGNKKFYKPCSSAWDYICSAASGALAATGIGKMAAMFASAIIGTINYVLNCASNKAKVCRMELIMTFVIGLICGYIGGSGANLKNVNGVVKTSKTILKTAVSPKKIAMYTSKIKNAIVSTVVNAIRYIVSAVANTLGSAGKKYVKGLLGC